MSDDTQDKNKTPPGQSPQSAETVYMQPVGMPSGGHIPVRVERPDGTTELGTLRPIRHGQPIMPSSDVYVVDTAAGVTTRGVPMTPLLVHDSTPSPAARTPHGPAQVASQRYREGWDATFGSNKDPSTLN